MAIIRRDHAQGVQPFDLATLGKGAPQARPVAFEDVTPRPPPPPAPPKAKTEPPPPPPPPAPPPAPPVVEVPQELVEALYEDVINRGREEIRSQLLGEYHAELKALQERYVASVERLEGVGRQLVDRNRMHVIQLACRVAERLVRHHLSTHPEHLLGLVREAMHELEERDEVVIHCCPGDYTFLTARRPDLRQGHGDTFRVQVVADESLEPGDFRVEARTGSVDARLSRRVADAEEALRAPDGEG